MEIKRKISHVKCPVKCGFFILCILCFFNICVYASDADAHASVVDSGGLLSQTEELELAGMLDDIISHYKCDAVVLTVQSLKGISPEDAADGYFDYNGYGIGDDRDGLLLLVSVEDRICYISTSGMAVYAFTDYGIDYITDKIAEPLGDGEYFEAFKMFAELCDGFLDEYTDSGKPYDFNNEFREKKTFAHYFILGAVSLAAGALIAFAATSSMKNRLKSVYPESGAYGYCGEGIKLTASKDIFLYRTVSRAARPKDNDNRSGGSGRSGGGGGGGSRTHSSSGGKTHGGGGRRF